MTNFSFASVEISSASHRMSRLTLSAVAILFVLSLGLTSGVVAKDKEDQDEASGEVTVQKATLVRDAGDKFETVTAFKPGDTFGVLVKLSEPKIGTKVKGIWTLVDAAGMHDKTILEKEVILTAEALAGAKQKDRIDFTLSHDDPYPAGDYKFEVYLNGDKAKTVEFKIE